MTRNEFCDLMAVAKERSGKTTNTISFDLRMQWTTLRKFEKGTNNSSMKKILEYLQVINAYIQIDKSVCINDYDNLVAWMINARKDRYSQRKLAEEIDVTYLTIANIERKATAMSLDIFLKIADVLGHQITIQNKSI